MTEDQRLRDRLEQLHRQYAELPDGFARDKVLCKIREAERNIVGYWRRAGRRAGA